jgi:hypothetical protein
MTLGTRDARSCTARGTRDHAAGQACAWRRAAALAIWQWLHMAHRRVRPTRDGRTRSVASLSRREVIAMAKPSKAALSKAGRTLASNSSSKSAKSKAGSTLGKG